MVRQSVVIGVVALIVVVGLGVAAYSLGPQLTSQTSTNSTSSSTSSSSSSQTQTTNTGTTSTTSSTTTGSSTSSAPGQMAVMATDPPVTASGVTKIVINYNGVQVHATGSASASGSAGNSASGWVNLNSSGSLDLESAVNFSQTIASAKLQANTYNMIRLNVSSAQITYNGQTYSATVRGNGELTAHMTGNVQVNSSVSSAALIDIRSFVINSGNSSNPQFFFSASAKATAVPPSDVTSASLQVGARMDLSGRAWFHAFSSQTAVKLSLSQVTLTSNSLTMSVKNSGNDTANIQMVVVTPMTVAGSIHAGLPPSFAGSAVFTVDSSGKLQSSGSLSLKAILGVAGVNMTTSSSTSLSFSGSIGLNLGLSLGQSTTIVSGQQYLISVIGDNTFASTTVVAG